MSGAGDLHAVLGAVSLRDRLLASIEEGTALPSATPVGDRYLLALLGLVHVLDRVAGHAGGMAPESEPTEMPPPLGPLLR